MRRGRILILVLLVFIVGLVVAGFALRQFLLSAQRAEQPAFVEVYVTAQNLAPGEKITADMVTTASIPQSMALGVYYTSDERPDLLNNKVARYPLDQGHIISSTDVQDASQGVSIAGPQHATLIPPGMTAVTIPTSRLKLGGYGVDDGSHVNVVACLLFVDVDSSFQSLLPNNTAVLTGTGIVPDSLRVMSMSVAVGGPHGRLELDPSVLEPFFLVPTEPQRPRPVCQMLLQDVVVMKRGNFPTAAVAGAGQGGAAGQPQPQPPNPDIVTLIVSPQDAVSLAYLTYTNAELTLSQRNPSDQARQATEAASLQFLLSQYNIPVPAKLPYAMQPAIPALTEPFLPNDTVTVQPQ
jgi:pilus assembly protein CpaB